MLLRFLLFITLFTGNYICLSANQEILISSPKKVIAGDDFIVNVYIPANLLHGISRVQLDIPNGFEAQVLNKHNSVFKFENQVALFQWLQFPESEKVEVSFNLSTPENIDGYFVLKASAYYLSNNEPIKVNIEPKIFTVEAAENDKDDMLIIKKKTVFTYDDFKSEGVACIRQVPYLVDKEIHVNLLVIKGTFNKYGKIQEKIPVGYNVSNLKSQNAIFVYNEKQRTIKYMWMNMPDKDKFVVSYKLIPTQKVDDNNPFLIYGTFFYAENKNTNSVDIKERGIDLENIK